MDDDYFGHSNGRGNGTPPPSATAPVSQFGGPAGAPPSQFGGPPAGPPSQFGGPAGAPPSQFGGPPAAPGPLGGPAGAPTSQFGGPPAGPGPLGAPQPAGQFGGPPASPHTQYGAAAAAPPSQFGGPAAPPVSQFGAPAAPPGQFGGSPVAPAPAAPPATPFGAPGAIPTAYAGPAVGGHPRAATASFAPGTAPVPAPGFGTPPPPLPGGGFGPAPTGGFPPPAYPPAGPAVPGGYGTFGGPPGPAAKGTSFFSTGAGRLIVSLVIIVVGAGIRFGPSIYARSADLKAPDRLAGLERNTDPQIEQFAERISTDLTDENDGIKSVSAIYGTPPNIVILVAGRGRLEKSEIDSLQNRQTFGKVQCGSSGNVAVCTRVTSHKSLVVASVGSVDMSLLADMTNEGWRKVK